MKIYLLTFILFFTTSLFANEKNLEKVSIQLHWKYQFEFAGFIAAKEKGFYKDIGLDVELKEYNFGDNIIEKVLNKESTYGIYNSNILLEYLNKKPIELISSYFKRSALVLITKPHIKYPKDLIGKNIMAAGIDDFNLNFNYIFSLEKIDLKDLNFIAHTFDVRDFQNENIDAMTAFISDQPYKLDKLNIKYNIIDPSNYGIFNLQLELFTSKDESNLNRTRTDMFKKASIKGWSYALENEDEIIDIILKKYNTQNLTKDFLQNEASYTKRLILPKMYDIGSIDEMYLYRQIDLFNNHSLNPSEKEHIIDNFIFKSQEQIDEKNKEKLSSFLTNSIPIFLLILIIIFYRQTLLKKYNKKLKNEVEKKTKEYIKKNLQLQNLNENFNILLNSVIETIAIFDENNRLIQLNNSGKDILKISLRDDLNSYTMDDFISKENISLIKKNFSCNKIEPFEIELFNKNKELFPALVSGKNIKNNKNIHTIITIVDLSQIKQRDLYIQQQSKLAQMGELLSMIAHQWRQPLAAISAASETLKIKSILNELDLKTVETTCCDITEYTNHLSNTINDFRNFYNVDKEKNLCNLDEVIQKALNFLKESLLYGNIQVILNLKSKNSIKTYKNELTQVILTLLQNAQEILIEKEIENPYIKINTYEDKSYFYIEIVDNGGEISKNIQSKIFEPYFSTKLEKNGTGLGLYFSKKIIESNCKGSLLFVNNKKETNFIIVLPK